MKAARLRAPWALLALLALASCAALSAPPAGEPGGPAADTLLERLWTTPPGIWRIRQAVSFEGHGTRVSLQGFAELDTARRRVRLTGLDDFGVTLFSLTVTSEGETTDFVLPGRSLPAGFAATVASSVRRVYLEPLPDRGDFLMDGPGGTRLSRHSGGRETVFTFSPQGFLVRTAVRGDGESWRAEYRGHRERAGRMVPETIAMEDLAAGYRLLINQVEARRDGE